MENKTIDMHAPTMLVGFVLDPATRAALLAAAELDDTQAIADHVTLATFAVTPDLLAVQKNAIVARLAWFAERIPPLSGVVGGYGRFVGAPSGQDALYASVDCPLLSYVREQIVQALASVGVYVTQDHGFVPHITLTYLDADAETPTLDIPHIPLTFAELTLAGGGDHVRFPLRGAPIEQVVDAAAAEKSLAAIDELPPLALAPVGEVKAITDARLRVRGIVYGGRDLVGDTFTPETDLGASRSFVGMPVYYDHAMGGIKSQIGTVVAYEFHDDGIDFDVELDKHKRYVETVLRLARAKALGGSTGALPHLVVREGGVIKRWIAGELSLTPTAAEPRTHSDIPFKAEQELGLQGAPQAAAATAATASDEPVRTAVPSLPIASRRKRMDPEELKAVLGALFEEHASRVDTQIKAVSDAVEARLKAFEEAPALKNSGWVSMDGGSADKHVKSFADWLLAVNRKDVKRLQTVYKSGWTTFDGEGAAVKDLGEGSGPAGGYLVPTEYESLLQVASAESAIVEPRARQIRMMSATKMVSMLRQTATPSTADGGSAFFGGLVFYWNPEHADLSTDKTSPNWEMVELIARKLTGITVSSNELIEDAPSLESELVQLFGEGLAHAKDFFYLRGNGVGRPLGVLNAPAAYSLTRAASGNNVEMADVSGMLARLLPGSVSRAIWVCHPLNIADIIQLKIGDTPVFQPNAAGPIAGTLLGRPIAFSEYSSAPGTKGDLMLCDFQAYAVGIRRGITIASSGDARFDNDQTTWRITYRGDGQPLFDSTVKLADGADTEVSPFVVLN